MGVVHVWVGRVWVWCMCGWVGIWVWCMCGWVGYGCGACVGG